MQDDPTQNWFPTDGEAAPDPTKAARQAMKAPLPKRFYAETGVRDDDGGFILTLDGRPARTPGRRPLALPTRALGEAVAAEWARQGDVIDPATMPLTRLANSAIDGVEAQREGVILDLVKYAGSDLICYRAGEPERLVADQASAWDPILAWLRETLGAMFVLSEGMMFVQQPSQAVVAVRGWLDRVGSPFQLAALHVMTTLTGSVLIAIAHAAGRLDESEAWAAAHVDEHYQEGVWGTDEQALARRDARERDFRAASATYRLSTEA